jgi:hemolysin activation/secretion protein
MLAGDNRQSFSSTYPMASPLRISRILSGFGLLLLVALTAVPVWAAGEGGGARFDVWEYEVSGNSVLDVQVIEKAVYPHLGEGKSYEDVRRAAESLEQAYRDAGYASVLVSIPEQPVGGGLIKLAVTEGRIERVLVKGAQYYSPERLLAQVPALKEGSVPDFNALKDQMAVANRSPDRRVQPVLRPGREPGMTEAELKVDDSLPLHASFEFNNRYSPSRAPQPGKYRASGTLRYDNLWQREHSISLSYLTSPTDPDEAQVSSLSYTIPLSGTDESLTLYGVNSNSNSDLTTSLAGSNVLGRGNIFGLRLAEPIRAVENISHGLTYGLDYKDLQENLVVTGTGEFQTPLTYWLGSVNYNGVRPDESGNTGFGVGLSLSLRGLTNNEEQFAQKRYRGQGNFVVMHWNLQRLQHLPAKFDLIGRLGGQLSSMALPSSEQFAIGGVDSVRGYPEATQVGDHGIRWGVELRTPNLMGGIAESSWGDLRLLAFYDGARARVTNPLPAQLDRVWLASYGLGLRLTARSGLTFSVDLAQRLRDGLITDTHGSVLKGGMRLHFNLGYQL